MRTEDIVGTTFFSLVVLGLAFVICGGNRTNPGARKPKWTATGMAIVGLAFLLFGLLSFYFVHTSSRLEATGTIENLRQTSGKGAGSRFFLAVNGGQTFALHASYHDSGIQQGEPAKVRFLEYNQNILDLTMLSGPTQGWHLTESDGSITYLLVSLAGVAFGCGAFRVYRKLAIRS